MSEQRALIGDIHADAPDGEFVERSNGLADCTFTIACLHDQLGEHRIVVMAYDTARLDP